MTVACWGATAEEHSKVICDAAAGILKESNNWEKWHLRPTLLRHLGNDMTPSLPALFARAWVWVHSWIASAFLLSSPPHLLLCLYPLLPSSLHPGNLRFLFSRIMAIVGWRAFCPVSSSEWNWKKGAFRWGITIYNESMKYWCKELIMKREQCNTFMGCDRTADGNFEQEQ